MIWLSFLWNNRLTRTLGLIVLGALSILTFGQIKKRQGAKEARTEDYIETRKDMDDAEVHGNDPDAARRWLHERQSSRDL